MSLAVMASWVRLDHPWWLLAAVAAALPLLLAFRLRPARAARARRGGTARGGVPLWAVAMQCAAVLMAAVALTRPSIQISRKSQLPWLILRDVSASTRGQALGAPFGDPNCPAWPADLPCKTVAFAHSLGPPYGDALEPGAPPAAQTLIRPPLQLALGQGKELAGAVVVSDGRWHDERWTDVAEAIARCGLPLLVVPLSDAPADARIAEFRAVRRPDGKVDLRVTAAANAPQGRKLTIRREGQDAPLFKKEVQLLPGEDFTAGLTDDARPAGSSAPPADSVATYRAELSPSDAFPENDAATATAPPASATLAVVMDKAGAPAGPGSSAHAGDLARLLPAAGPAGELQAGPLAGMARREIPARQAPRSTEEWTPYSLVFLVDPNGDLLDASQRSALGQYVRDGGGLVVVGTGPSASAQDRQDPLNRSAALVPNPYERRPLRVVVVLDSSGSMGEARLGERKFDLAVLAVASMRSHLTSHDSLAVITFSDTPRLVYDSAAAPPPSGSAPAPAPTGGPAGPDFAALREALAKVQPGGPTVVAPALEEATAAPAPPGTEGLVIVVSDLAAKPFDEERMARRFRDGHFALAVIDIGPASPPASSANPPVVSAVEPPVVSAQFSGDPKGSAVDPPVPSAVAPPVASAAEPRPSLATLAKLLDGPVVAQENLAGLAEVFARFIRQSRGDVVRRGDFRIQAPLAVFGQDAARLPALQAYVLSAPQEGAQVLASVGEDPVIARHTVGLGRSVSVALLLGGPVNAPLLGDGVLRDLLAGAGAWACAPANDPRFSCLLARSKGKLLLHVEASEGGEGSPAWGSRGAGGTPMNLLKLTARIVPVASPARPGREGAAEGSFAPSARWSEPEEVPLEQVAPGRYEASLGDAKESLLVQVVDSQARTLWRGAWGAGYAEEFAGIGADWANLQRLAELAGGRLVPMSSLSATGRELLRDEYTPIAAILLAAAAAIMLLEWATVRVIRR